MDTELATLFLLLLLPFAFLVVAVVNIFWMRRNQRRAMSRVDESIELSRRSVKLHERAVRIAEEMLENQIEMVESLRRLSGRDTLDSGIRP